MRRSGYSQEKSGSELLISLKSVLLCEGIFSYAKAYLFSNYLTFPERVCNSLIGIPRFWGDMPGVY
jgi:hypothetical protein